jgi:exodeoxyribonuclease VII small subunit
MENENKKTDNLTFEDAVKELESIINTLEAGDVPLEKSLELFKRGISLTALCNEKLTEAQGVVKLLYKDRTGDLREAPFEPDEKEQRG